MRILSSFWKNNFFTFYNYPGGLRILSRCLGSSVTLSSQRLGALLHFQFYLSFYPTIVNAITHFNCHLSIWSNDMLNDFDFHQVWLVQPRFKGCNGSASDEQVYLILLRILVPFLPFPPSFSFGLTPSRWGTPEVDNLKMTTR